MERSDRLTPAVRAGCLAVLMAFGAGPVHAGAKIVIINRDGGGEGFNDGTPAAAEGGNLGVTLGEQRLIAFQFAADLWAVRLRSSIEIRVAAHMDPLPCDPVSAVLGAAGPATVHRDFAAAPLPLTWYPQALANGLAQQDLAPGFADIVAFFNSTLNGDPACLDGRAWYYGLDGNPPQGRPDFVTTVLHELGHGLGFLTLVDAETGEFFQALPDIFAEFMEDHSTRLTFPEMSNAERQAAATNTGNLHFIGPRTLAAAPERLTAGFDADSGHVLLYAPSTFDPGSSLSHFDVSLDPDEVMEPFFTGPNHDPGLALELLGDLGWPLSDLAAPPTTVEVGKASIDHTWRTVVLRGNFTDPVIVAKPASLNGLDPGAVRLRGSTPSGFQVRFEEWNYLNRIHAHESVSYLAVERGRHSLDGGEIEAGSVQLVNARPSNAPFVPVVFETPFPVTPIVFAAVASANGADTVTTRLRNVGTTGFEVVMQEQESGGLHAPETVNWIAWGPGTGVLDGDIPYEAGTQANVGSAFAPVNFFDVAAQCFLADIQTFTGMDTATLRFRDLTESGVSVKVAEEQSLDEETFHIGEQVGYAAFECLP